MERATPNLSNETTNSGQSVVEYLFGGDSGPSIEKAQEVIRTIDQILVYDERGKLSGILDETYLDDYDVRRLVGNNYAQTEELSHLGFILNTKPRDLLELDEVTLPSGGLLGDLVYDSDEVSELPKNEVKTVEEAVARRAVVIKAACQLIVVEFGSQGKGEAEGVA